MSQNCREVHLSVSGETPVERIRDTLSALEWSWLLLNGAKQQTEIRLNEGTLEWMMSTCRREILRQTGAEGVQNVISVSAAKSLIKTYTSVFLLS